MVDKILRDTAFNITKTQNMTDINVGYLNGLNFWIKRLLLESKEQKLILKTKN